MCLTVQIRYFGILAARAGTRSESVRVPAGSRVSGLLRQMAQAHSDTLGAALFPCDTLSALIQVFHNGLPLGGGGLEAALADGDEVLIFPLVSGGLRP